MTDTTTTETTKSCEPLEEEHSSSSKTTPEPSVIANKTKESAMYAGDSSGTSQQTLTTTIIQAAPGKLSQPIPQLTVEQQLQKLRRDLESMVLKYAKSEQENLKNQQRVDELEKKLKKALKDNEQLANRIKILTNDKNQLTDTLNAKIAQLTVLEQKNSTLTNEQATLLKDYENQIKQLETENEELKRQLETQKGKENDLLDMSERLSMRHMLLQSELDDALTKAPDFEEQYKLALQEKDQLVRQREEMSEQVERLIDNLEKERQLNETLKQERELEASNFQRRFDEFDNELKMLKRKHQVAIKVLTKELKQQAKLNSVQ